MNRRHRGRGGKNGHEPRVRIRQREHDVIRLSTEGRSQHDIAKALGISQPAVSQILRRADERWAGENQHRVSQHKAEQIRKLDHLYREAMKSWEHSKSQRTRRRQRKTNGPGTAESGAMAEVIIDDSHGDARFLEAARRVLADLTKVWGVNTPREADEATADGPVQITLQIGDERTAPQVARPSSEP